MKKWLLLVAIPLIAIGSLTYATENDFIVHDTTGGTITIYTGDFSYGITIQDKNLGANKPGTGEESYGYYFQWGNNHGNLLDPITTTVLAEWDDSYENHGYDGSITGFIISLGNSQRNYWSGVIDYDNTGSKYHNLRGGGNDNDNINPNIIKGYNVISHEATNLSGRQGPCIEGFHVPSIGEWNEIKNIWHSIMKGSEGNSVLFSNELLIPIGQGGITLDGSFNQNNRYRSSSPRGGAYAGRYGPNYSQSFYIVGGLVPIDFRMEIDSSPRGMAYPIRCFKNKYIEFPSYSLTFDSQGGSEIDTGITIENTPRTRPDDPTRDGYIFVDWYTSTGYDTVFDFTTLATGDLTVYAKWGCETGYKDNGTECVLNKDIVIEATSTAANQTLKINKYFANAYTVDWGDGTTGNVTADTGHTYSVASGYTITLSPSSSRWTFQNIAKPLIPKNGTTMTGVKITYMPSLADGFGANATDPGNYFFYSFNSNGVLTSLPNGSFDTSKITTVGNSFFSNFNLKGALTSLPDGSFDTSKITTTVGESFFGYFNEKGALTSLPEGSFRFSTGLTEVGNFFFSSFNYNGALTNLPEGSFNISKITSVGNYFFYSFNFGGALTSLPEGSFDISNITSVGDNFFTAFNYGGALTSLPEGSFDISKITTVGNYFFQNFNNNGSITSLPEGSFDTSNITTVGNSFFYKFNENGQLTSLPDGSFDTSKITTVGNYFFFYFNADGAIINLPEGSFRFSTGLTEVGDYFFSRFNNNGSITSLPKGSFDISKITTVGDDFFAYFNYNGALTRLPERSFDTSKITTVGKYFFWYFNNNGSITSLPEGSFDTSKITTVGNYFFGYFNNSGALISLPNSFKLTSAAYNKSNGYYRAFYSSSYTLNRKVSDLVSGITAPSNDRDTFSNNQPGRCGVHPNWLVTTADACSISYDDGQGGTGEFKYTADTTGVVAGSGMVEPTRIGYTFSGWIDASGNNIEEVIFPDMDGQTLYANWMPNEYAIVFVDGSGDNESVIYSGKYNLAVEVQYPNWTKEGYTIHWDKEIPTTMPLSGETITASWTKKTKPSGGSSGGGGGGGGGGSSSSCKNLPANAVVNNSSTPSSNTNYYYSTNTSKVCTFQCKSGYTRNAEKETCDKASDSQTTTGTNVKEPEINTGNNTKVETGNNIEVQTGSKIDTQPAEQAPEQTHQNDNSNTQDSSTSSQNDGKTYSTEFQEAYEFAKENGITTMSTIQKANMNGKLTRIAMAKMLSQYAMNVLGQKPANIVTPKFNDVTDKQNSDYDGGVTLSYQLGIMGQNMPNNKFRPNDEVTRAEFATALSRMVYHTSDGEYKSTPKYYIRHMEKLVKEGIITKDDPEMKELRGYVMIMLMRSAK